MENKLTFSPYNKDELWERYHQKQGTINKHLLMIYSLAYGLKAKKIIDIGIGSTTKTLRFAAQHNGGIVYSCDYDKIRYNYLLDEQNDFWKLYLCDSESFIKQIDPPFDFVLHDGAHDYLQVKKDLKLIFPKMRQFGIICIHDTQNDKYGKEMISAIKDAGKGAKISYTHIPYNLGLTIIRIEKGDYEYQYPQWDKKKGKTECYYDPCYYRNNLFDSIFVKIKSILRLVRNYIRKKFVN